ncbi:MAG: 5-formyltetrahydrofolate cyclo-ligase [Hadesarchaea archaeon]|nr:5-formyltetrahydrofolate cyclo-ligase [Hadesarchaea archaeon]
MLTEVKLSKQQLRERIWRELEAKGVISFPKPSHGRIPNFLGSELAAERLRSLPPYTSAEVIMANPDAAQLAVRRLALADNKKLVMASPRLRAGFLLLDPERIRDPARAATIRGAFKYGRIVDVEKIKVDLVVEGSVAVDLTGGRLGKGGGFGDLEVAILTQAGAIDDATPIATTVHELQIVESVPMAEHDVPVDLIVTPERVIKVPRSRRRPRGILWHLLPPDVFKRMPILAELRREFDSGCG